MEIGVLKARPPHLSFIRVAVEDRDGSIANGYPTFKDVDHVRITPQGSRDSVEKPVADWLLATDQQVREERLPPEWAEKFRGAYEHWKRGEEVPIDGTPLVVWPAISPAELQACKNVHILSLEDLAVANDEAVRKIGMGGLALKQRAQKYLAASGGPGKLVAENADLQAKFKDSESRRLSLEERVIALEKLVQPASPVQHIKGKPGIEEKL
jgi:hypothetical protein